MLNSTHLLQRVLYKSPIIYNQIAVTMDGQTSGHLFALVLIKLTCLQLDVLLLYILCCLIASQADDLKQFSVSFSCLDFPQVRELCKAKQSIQIGICLKQQPE